MIDYIINILKKIFNNEGIRTEPDTLEEEKTIERKPKEIKIGKKKSKKVTKKKKR